MTAAADTVLCGEFAAIVRAMPDERRREILPVLAGIFARDVLDAAMREPGIVQHGLAISSPETRTLALRVLNDSEVLALRRELNHRRKR